MKPISSMQTAGFPIHIGEHAVTESRSLRLDDARGRRIDCLAGSLWITIAGQCEDYHLAAGQHLIVPANGRMLVGTLAKTPARLRIDYAKPWMVRILHLLAVHNGGRASSPIHP